MVEILNPESLFEDDLRDQHPNLVTTEPTLEETIDEQLHINNSETAFGEAEQPQLLFMDKKRLGNLFKRIRNTSNTLRNIYTFLKSFSKISWMAKYILYLLSFVVLGLIALCGYALFKIIVYVPKGLKWCFTFKRKQPENSNPIIENTQTVAQPNQTSAVSLERIFSLFSLVIYFSLQTLRLKKNGWRHSDIDKKNLRNWLGKNMDKRLDLNTLECLSQDVKLTPTQVYDFLRAEKVRIKKC